MVPGTILNRFWLSQWHLSSQHLSTSVISQLLLTRFCPWFKGRFMGPSLTDANYHSNICPGNICPGNICPHQEYFSYCWPNFDQTIVRCLNFFGPKFFTLIFLPLLFFNPKLFWTQIFQDPNFLEPKIVATKIFGPKVLWVQNIIWINIFFWGGIIFLQKCFMDKNLLFNRSVFYAKSYSWNLQ